MTKKMIDVAGMSKEDIQGAIQHASTATELDSIWGTLETQGYSKEGQMYAAVLQRKAAVGHSLTPAERQAVERITAEAQRGKALAPIGGEFTPGGVQKVQQQRTKRARGRGQK